MVKKLRIKRKDSFTSALSRAFLEARMILYANRMYPLCAFLILLLFSVVGYIFPNFMIDFQKQILENIVKQVPTDNPVSTSFFIIQNNLRATLVGMSLGILIIFPFLMMAANGYIIGAVMNRAAESLGPEVLLRLLPHGIFEIPAICIAAGFGMKIAVGIFKKENLGENYKKAFIVYLFIVLPLIIIAGIIEGLLFYLIK